MLQIAHFRVYCTIRGKNGSSFQIFDRGLIELIGCALNIDRIGTTNVLLDPLFSLV
jgi:hypothetical protein